MRRTAIVASAIAMISVSTYQVALAGAEEGSRVPAKPPVTADDESDTVVIEVGDGGSGGGSGGSAGGSSRPQCTYRRAYFRDVPGYDPVDNDHAVTVRIDGVVKHGYFKSCPGRPRVMVLIDETVSVQDMIDQVSDSIRRRIPQPVANVNPAPEHGGFVNLGLWLAVADPGPISAHAAAGSVSATAFAQHVSTTFDFGNGDSLTCEGGGTPIEDVHPDLDTTEQGPCGYTYTQSSPDDAPYQLTISSTFAITYTSSGGAGNLGTITTSRTYPYDVDEIQTVGTRG